MNRNGTPSGTFAWHYPPLRLNSQQIDAVIRSGNTAIIFGAGKLADGTPVTYVLEVTSGGRSRTGHFASLSVSNGYSAQNVTIATATVR